MGRDSRTLAVYLNGASQQDADLYLLINASESDSTFQIQEGRAEQWQLAFDTSHPSPDDFPEPGDSACLQTLSYLVGGRSIAGLIRESAQAN
jgi:glycogen operon protein